jgi:hypothetical protein
MKVDLTDELVSVLLKGRGIIDVHRQEKASLSGSIYKSLDSLRATLTSSYTTELKELGFESLDEFGKWNEDMCLAEHMDYLQVVSYCNHCEGYKDKPPCVVTCGETALYYHWKGTDDDILKFRKYTLNIRRNMHIKADKSVEIKDTKALVSTAIKHGQSYDEGTFSICPKGMGFQYKYIHNPRFDVTWKV